MIKISSNTLSAPLLAARATAVTLPGYSVFNSKKPRKQEEKKRKQSGVSSST